VLTEYCYEHQENEQWLVIGYIVNPDKRTDSLENDFLDYVLGERILEITYV